MDYKSKYLKYKSKYLKLRGGAGYGQQIVYIDEYGQPFDAYGQPVV